VLVSAILLFVLMKGGPEDFLKKGPAFAVIIGKEVFGGTGMNILNPALTARAFLFFAYPSYMSGDSVWISGLMKGEGVIDGFSGATALGQAAVNEPILNTTGDPMTAMEMFTSSVISVKPSISTRTRSVSEPCWPNAFTLIPG